MWQIRPGLESLQSYHVPDIAWPIKLDANERADDPPPLVKEKLVERLAAVAANRYPEIDQHSLKAHRRSYGLRAENVPSATVRARCLPRFAEFFGAPAARRFPQPLFLDVSDILPNGRQHARAGGARRRLRPRS
jgi:histidinol-phosphate/aromatic aminotransferase/cobyric acid decarboxylase-like protein